jgi:hypothetical protein
VNERICPSTGLGCFILSPCVDSPDLLQQVFHSAAVSNQGVWLDSRGGWRIVKSRTQGHRQEPAPRHKADNSPDEPIVPRIPEWKTVKGKLDPPAELLTALIQGPLPACPKTPLPACLVQALDFVAQIADRPYRQESSPECGHGSDVPFRSAPVSTLPSASRLEG